MSHNALGAEEMEVAKAGAPAFVGPDFGNTDYECANELRRHGRDDGAGARGERQLRGQSRRHPSPDPAGVAGAVQSSPGARALQVLGGRV